MTVYSILVLLLWVSMAFSQAFDTEIQNASEYTVSGECESAA